MINLSQRYSSQKKKTFAPMMRRRTEGFIVPKDDARLYFPSPRQEIKP